jgi:DMSO/TMAO reductase YedYZ molybdopterin-dependent catalytic subunit
MSEKKPGPAAGALVGLLLTAPLTAVLYFINALTGLAFAPFAAFDWVRDRLPAGVINSGLERLAGTLTALGISVRQASKPAEIVMVLGVFLAAGVITGAIFFQAVRSASPARLRTAGLIPGVVFGLPLALMIVAGLKGPAAPPWLSALWTLAAFLGWGYAFGRIYSGLSGAGRESEQGRASTGPASVARVGRRKFLITLGASSAVITVAGAGLARALARRAGPPSALPAAAGKTLADDIHAQAGPIVLPNRNDPVLPAPGTRPEYTPLEDHYRIDINLSPPVIDGDSWSLRIGGLVQNPVTLTLRGLVTKYPRMNQFITLSCISNPVGGDLIGTTLWTGVSLQKILGELRVEEGARFLQLESVDGYRETVPLDLIRGDERIMFAYAWDGRPLEAKHGFPLRIYIPDRYGMKQPKWITKAEITADDKPGYWVERGWSREARARSTSVIDTGAVDGITTSPDGKRLVPVGGTAWAGARGISKVEVRVDRGDWIEADLRGPLSPTTWVIWRYDWPFASGSHRFTVRCSDGRGAPQVETTAGAFPDGATGLSQLEKKIPGR